MLVLLLPLDIEAPTKDGVAAIVAVVVGSTDDELDEEELEEVVSSDVVVAAGVVSHDEAAVSVAVSLLVAAVLVVVVVVVVVAVKLAAPPPPIERIDVRREPTKVDSAREMIGIEWSHSSRSSGSSQSAAGSNLGARRTSRDRSAQLHECTGSHTQADQDRHLQAW